MKKANKKYGSLQDWFLVDIIFDDGIIKLKNHQFIKILNVKPINYQLKSELEKNAILNSYKTFLKSYQDNIQVIIQSKKEDFSNHIENIKRQNKKENYFNKKIMIDLSQKYIDFIHIKNKEKNSSSKNFYLLIRSQTINESSSYEMIRQELKEKYFKIKDLLARCGNEVTEMNDRETVQQVYFSFLNVKECFY